MEVKRCQTKPWSLKIIKINQTNLLFGGDGCELNVILSIQEKIASSLVEPLVAKPLE